MKTLVTLAVLMLANSANAEPWYYQDSRTFEFQIPDKVQHYWGSYFLSRTTSPAKAFAAGALWELKQKLQGGEFGEKDLLMDFLGSYRIGHVEWNQRSEYWMLTVSVRF